MVLKTLEFSDLVGPEQLGWKSHEKRFVSFLIWSHVLIIEVPFWSPTSKMPISDSEEMKVATEKREEPRPVLLLRTKGSPGSTGIPRIERQQAQGPEDCVCSGQEPGL